MSFLEQSSAWIKEKSDSLQDSSPDFIEFLFARAISGSLPMGAFW